MRVRNRVAALLTATAASAAVLAGSAVAAQAAPANVTVPTGPTAPGAAVTQVNPTTYTKPYTTTVQVSPLAAAWKICTRSGTTRCMTAEGVGYQFQMHASGYSTFSDLGGTFGDVFQTPNGLCPHAADAANSYVVTGETACSTSNQAYQWFVTSDSPDRLLNPLYNRYLAVLFNNQEGAKTTTQPGTGAFYLGRFGS